MEKEEKRQYFTDFIRYINVIEFPNESDDPKRIHLLSFDEQIVLGATYYLQDYDGQGFSIIIEEVDQDTVNLKIYEPHTDDFFVKKNIVVRNGIIEKYKIANKDNTYLNIGVIEKNGENIKIRPNNILKIPLKSISFSEKLEKE